MTFVDFQLKMYASLSIWQTGKGIAAGCAVVKSPQRLRRNCPRCPSPGNDANCPQCPTTDDRPPTTSTTSRLRRNPWPAPRLFYRRPVPARPSHWHCQSYLYPADERRDGWPGREGVGRGGMSRGGRTARPGSQAAASWGAFYTAVAMWSPMRVTRRCCWRSVSAIPSSTTNARRRRPRGGAAPPPPIGSKICFKKPPFTV